MARKILITDDEQDLELVVRQKFRSRIKSGELAFEFAFNGQEALDKLLADSDFEVVFTDISMPVMNGLELLSNIKSKGYEVKTIVVSAYGDEKSIRRAMNEGAFDFINKPVDLDDFEATLNKSLSEIDIFKKGKEAQKQLDQALLEKAKAQAEALKNLQEKEKLILKQNEMLEQQVNERTREIREQKEVIETKNLEILESIHYAKRLQEALLPEKSLLNEISKDSFLIYRPKDIVSGDFFWIRNAPNKMFAVADCTGHGVSGALMSMLGSSLLDRVTDNFEISDPGQMLDALHQLVVESLRQKESQSNEGMDIAIIKIDSEAGYVDFAGANRPLWVFRDGQILILQPDKMPIGGMQYPDRKPYTTHHFKLETNDRIFMFSDGYGDQFGGPHGKKIMTSNLRVLLCQTASLPIQDQGIEIQNYLHDWQGDSEQVDDILVAGMQL